MQLYTFNPINVLSLLKNTTLDKREAENTKQRRLI